jgi:hypothetical protein
LVIFFIRPRGKWKASGKRVKHGLYESGDGSIVNADLNGAANILREHQKINYPILWDGQDACP